MFFPTKSFLNHGLLVITAKLLSAVNLKTALIYLLERTTWGYVLKFGLYAMSGLGL